MKFDILNRWSGKVQFTVEIDCSEDASYSIKLGLAVLVRYKSGADLRDADLSDADLRGAVLRGADLRDAPKIPDIHKAVYAAASQPGALDMSTWHRPCGTTHCRAGWVVTLAGEAGAALEFAMGTAAAAAVIYLASDPKLAKIPNFYADNETALAEMKQLAEDAAS